MNSLIRKRQSWEKKKTNGEHPCPIWDITWCEPHMLEDVCAHARTKTDHLSSDEHNCYCATQWLPEKMYVCYFVLELVCEVRTCVFFYFLKWLPFNTLEIDSSKPGLHQGSHDHPKQPRGNAIQWLWSALLIKLNACLHVCTVAAAAAVCPEGRGQTRLGRWNSDHAQIQIG